MKKCSKLASLFAMLLIALGAVACKQEPTPVDTTAPANVTNLEVTAANGDAVLSWRNPTDEDFAGVKISVSPAEGTLENAVTLDKGVTTFSVSGLTIENYYTFTIKTFDTSLNYSIGRSKSITVRDTSDKTAPEEVTDLMITAANGNAVLSWTNPTDEDFAGVKISVSPAEGTLENAVTLDKGVTTFSVSGLTIEKEYTFTIKTFDTSLNYSIGTRKSITVSDTSDKTAPAEVTNLEVTAKNSSVLLTWTDPVDEDLFGIEITYTSGTNARSAINAMVEKSIFVAPKTKSATITNLTNGTSYIFTVKTMDTSGNKSSGVKSDSVSPKAVEVDGSEPLSIALTTSVPQENGYTGNKSNTTVTVTANITTANAVKKVVYKKDGTKVAADLLADEDATELTVDENDNKKWTFTLTATDESLNGTTYTIAAIDEAGREEAEQITIDQFDFTAPAKVNVTSSIYSRELSCIILNWTEPSNEDFDHVKITYTSSDDGTSYSKESEAVTVSKGTANKTFTDIDSSKAYYTYYLVSVDAVGNESATLKYRVSVNPSAINLPEGFVLVDGVSFDGTETWTPSSSVFKSGRAITIRDLLVSDHEVTQGEYETYCKYGDSYYSPSYSYGIGDNFPAYYVNWYDAIVYCNLRSIAEGLTPVYKLGEESDPKNWDGIISTDGKYCGPSNSQWDAITMDIEANGYRLPTEAEWEYLARGGETTSTTYSGSDNIDDVAWYSSNSYYITYITHEVKGKKPNDLGLYDMSGNVWEWCWDWYSYSSDITSSTPETGAASGSYRCLRGGCWYYNASYCSVSYRNINYPYYRGSYYGFRVVRSISK